jgi:hypothetical protein
MKDSATPALDCEAHYHLREVLGDGAPKTYGELRRNHGFSPVFLERQADTYGEIFETGTELSSDRPTIRLLPGGLPTREDILVKRQLTGLVRKAGETGIYLRSLYTLTGHDSKTVRRLLAEVPEVTTTRKNRNAILYKWVEPEKSRIQDYVSSESSKPLNDGRET